MTRKELVGSGIAFNLRTYPIADTSDDMVEDLYDWLMNKARLDTGTGKCSLMEYSCANWKYKSHPCAHAFEAGAKAESTSVASVFVRLASEEVGELLLAVSMPKGLLPGRR